MEIMNERVKSNILNALFPTHELANERRQNKLNTEFLPFSTEELRTAVVDRKSGKAPGSDGIPPEVTRKIASKKSVLLLGICNAPLRAYCCYWRTVC